MASIKPRQLPFVEETVKKRVRMALDAGDDVTARKEIRMVLMNDEDVEAYFKHLAEEKAQQDREEFERAHTQDDDSDLLASALESLTLDRSVVPCPVCEKGSIRQQSKEVVTCTVCDFRLTLPGGLTRICDLLNEQLSQHALECTSKQRPTFAVSCNQLSFCCENCRLKRVIF